MHGAISNHLCSTFDLHVQCGRTLELCRLRFRLTLVAEVIQCRNCVCVILVFSDNSEPVALEHGDQDIDQQSEAYAQTSESYAYLTTSLLLATAS